MLEARKQASVLLEKVLEGAITAEEARNKWPDYFEDHLLEKTYCLLFHYDDDVDIRARDERYAKWQVGEFKKLIDELRTIP